MKIDLTDGYIFGIDEDSDSSMGCPTCDYGSEYIKKLTFYISLSKDNSNRDVIVESKQMYEFNEKMNVANTIEILCDIMEEPISYDDFVDSCNTWFGKDCEVRIREF